MDTYVTVPTTVHAHCSRYHEVEEVKAGRETGQPPGSGATMACAGRGITPEKTASIGMLEPAGQQFCNCVNIGKLFGIVSKRSHSEAVARKRRTCVCPDSKPLFLKTWPHALPCNISRHTCPMTCNTVTVCIVSPCPRTKVSLYRRRIHCLYRAKTSVFTGCNGQVILAGMARIQIPSRPTARNTFSYKCTRKASQVKIGCLSGA